MALLLRPATGALWIGDVGQNAWEEIDYARPGRPAGANFGWNGYEGTHVYDAAVAARLNRSSLTWPVSQYGHNVGSSVTGGYVYRGSAVAALRGFYLFADYSGRGGPSAAPGRSASPSRGGPPGRPDRVVRRRCARRALHRVLAGSVYAIVPR